MPTLGRGRVYFDKFVSGTKVGQGERYLGNTPSFSLNSESQTLDHYNSDEGVKTKDDSVLLQLNRKGAFTSDVVDPDNLALFFLGDAAVATQASATGQTDSITGVQQGRYYQLGKTALNPTGVRSLSNVVIADTAGPTTYTVTTDYTVDLTTGRLYIVPGGNIADDTDLDAITFDVAAKSRNQIITAASATIEGALRFIAANPKGDDFDYFMPYVQLAPNGDFQLKGDEWQVLSFNVEILQLSDTIESIYIDGRPY